MASLIVLDKDLATPPGSPADGDSYLLYVSPTVGSDWDGHKGEVASWYERGNRWRFYEPSPGWEVYVVDEALKYIQTSNKAPWLWTALGAAGFPDMFYHRRIGTDAPEMWQIAPPGNAASLANVNLSTDVLRAMPLVIAKDSKADRLGMAKNSGSGKIRIGIYKDDGNVYPGDLLLDAGEQTIDVIFDIKWTISQSLPQGLYWIAANADSNPLMLGFNPADAFAFIGMNSAFSGFYSGYTVSQAYGALPDPFPSGAGASLVGGGPAMLMRLTTP